MFSNILMVLGEFDMVPGTPTVPGLYVIMMIGVISGILMEYLKDFHVLSGVPGLYYDDVLLWRHSFLCI